MRPVVRLVVRLALRLLPRILLAVPTLLGVTLVTFALMQLAPGDPVTFAAGTAPADARFVAENRERIGLDRPLAQRYAAWLVRSATLDFGTSLQDGRTVRARLAEALPPTATMACIALVLALLFAIPVGAAAAVSEGTRAGLALDVGLSVAYGVPVMALAICALRAGAPFGGGPGVGGLSFGGLWVPALCLAFPSALMLARQQRSALLSVLGADYLTTARAMGASPARVLFRHALPGALLPMVTLAGTQVPALLSGSVLVERVFGVAGLGTLGYDAVLARDYPLLMGLATLVAALAITGVLIADGAALLIDPRLRDQQLPDTRPRPGRVDAR